jgi:SAM-dependent methyltransferase
MKLGASHREPSRVVDPSGWTAFPLLHDPGPCPLCAASSLRSLHLYSNAKAAVSRALNLALIGCESCGIVFSHPLPTDDELDRFYSDQTGWEVRIPSVEAGIAQRLEHKRVRYLLHVGALEHLIGEPAGEQRRVLDFGCGIGAWLDVLKERGWETYGIEPGPRARAIAAREHTMLEAIPTEATFDLVIANHVLEHLRDPLEVTRALGAATKVGGHLYVSVPDLGRLPAHRSMSYVANERHIFSYTSSSLRSLFALAGFELIAHSNEPSWPVEPVDKLDTKSVRAFGLRVEGTVPLVPGALAEAISSMLEYEPEAAQRLVEPPSAERARTKQPPPANRKHVRAWRSRLRRILKRIRRFFRVWLRAAIRVRFQRLRP